MFIKSISCILFIFCIFLTCSARDQLKFERIKLEYLKDKKKYRFHCTDICSCRNPDLKIIRQEEKGRFIYQLIAQETIELLSVKLEGDFSSYREDKIFCNGFQSWTISEERDAQHKIKPLHPLLKAYSKSAGDYFYYKYPKKKGLLHSWSYAYIRQNEDFHLLASLAEHTGFSCLIFDLNQQKIALEKDCKYRVVPKGENYLLCDLLQVSGNQEAIFERYAQELQLPKPKVKGAIGWTSWYHYYENISEDIILQNLRAHSKANYPIDIFQIDDGYQKELGDWLESNEKFPRGMKVIADSIHQAGYKAGLWLAPFVCSKRSSIYKNHKDWLVKNKNGRPLFIAKNVAWKSKYYALDIYNPEARAHIEKTLKTILFDWGYDMIKVDFLFAVCLQGNRDKTRGAIMHDAMALMRKVAGKKIILACGVPLAPCFGQVDYCRIGNDAHLDWEFPVLKKLRNHERPSTIGTLRNTLLRASLSPNMFLNDPDVFILRDYNTNLNEQQKHTMFLLNNLLGSVIFTSDPVADYDSLQQFQYKKAFPFRKKEAIQVLNYDDAYRIDFRIGSRQYLALSNLSEDVKKIPVPNGSFYCAESNQLIELNDSLEIAPFSSNIYYKLSQDYSVEFLGSNNYLFSGAELNALSFNSSISLHLRMHPQAQRQRPQYFIVHRPDIKRIEINNQWYPVEQINNYRGVRLNTIPPILD